MDAVDEGSRSGPIEVELTAHEPARRARRRRAAAPPGPTNASRPDPSEARGRPDADREPSGDPVVGVTAPGPLASPQGRLVATAVAVGLVGLVLGWVLGRSGGDESVTDVAPPSTVVRTTTTLLGGDTLPEVVVTTAPRATLPRSTTTVPPPRSESQVEIAPVLQSAARAYRLVGFDTGGRMFELDTASGELTTTRLLGGNGYDPMSVMVGADWVLVPDPNGGASRLFRDGQDEPERVDVGDPWQLLHIPGTELFWRAADTDERGIVGRFEQVDLQGRPTGTSIDVPATWGWQADPAGGLVTWVYGRSYHVDDGGVSLLGSGDLMALDATIAVVRDCDPSLRCGLFVVDRATGEQRPVAGDVAATADRSFESLLNWGPWVRSPVSPDGALCAIFVFTESGANELTLLDLATGETTSLATETYPPVVEWSPDGRFAFYLDRGRPMFWDRTSGAAGSITIDVTNWQSLALRPPSAPSEG